MVVAPQPEATEAGVEAMRAGGNAVDAAIACALVQSVVDPLMCGIAGFGSCGIYMPGENFHGYIDFHAPAPLAARPDMWADLIEGEARDGYGFILKGRVNDIGYQSICAPANLRAYRGSSSRSTAALPWKRDRASRPSNGREMAGRCGRTSSASGLDEGELGRAPNPSARLHASRRARSIAGRDGTPKRVGERDYQSRLRPDPARSSPRRAAAVFYEGEIADAIAEDMRATRPPLAR